MQEYHPDYYRPDPVTNFDQRIHPYASKQEELEILRHNARSFLELWIMTKDPQIIDSIGNQLAITGARIHALNDMTDGYYMSIGMQDA